MRPFIAPYPEFNVTLGALFDELGVPIDVPRPGGLAPFTEADRDYPVMLSVDEKGDWHVHTYDGRLNDTEWAPTAEQAAWLCLEGLQGR